MSKNPASACILKKPFTLSKSRLAYVDVVSFSADIDVEYSVRQRAERWQKAVNMVRTTI